MGKPRDPAVTEYVRWRMRALVESKTMTGERIAEIVGVSPATISGYQTLGVGPKSIDGYAKLFNFKDADAMRRTAYEWWRDQQPKTTSRAQDPGVVAAVERLKALQPWVKDEQIRTILHRFSHEDFDERDESYWLVQLGQEVAQDTLRAQRRAAEMQNQAGEREREKRKVQSAFREASAVKKKLEEDKAVAELEAPPAETDVAPERGSGNLETQIRPKSLRDGRRKKQA